MRAVAAGYTVLHRFTFDLAQDLAEAAATGTRKEPIAGAFATQRQAVWLRAIGGEVGTGWK